MTMLPTLTRPPHEPHRRGARLSPGLVLAAVFVLAAAAVPGWRLLQLPATIDRLVITNATPYDLDIDVTGGDRDGWLGLGTAHRNGSTRFLEVIDQGDVWIFRLRGQGADAGELPVTRSEFVASGWRLDVPAGIGEGLKAAGVPPPPRADRYVASLASVQRSP